MVVMMAGKKVKKSPFWERVYELEAKPKRKRMGVNLSKISRYSKAGQMVVVPDKVLSSGKLAHAVTVAAPSFSAMAMKIIKAAGGKTISLQEAEKATPTGKDVAIII
jgi:large subunit ribosomal protein L18e